MSKLNSFIGGLLLGGVLLGVIGYFSEGFQKNPFENTTNTSEDSGLTTDSIISDGISVKALNTKDNGDGTVTKTFTYTVQPETATNQEITVKAQYVGGEDCSEVITVTVDTSQKTVSVLNKADFDKQVEVILTSVDNPSATAKVTCDYVKKIKDVRLAQSLSSVSKFDVEGGFIIPTYSKFTKDKEYNFSVSSVSVKENYQENQWFSYNDDGTISGAISSLIKEKIESMTTLPTAKEIFDVSKNSEWQNYLVNEYDGRDGWYMGPFESKVTLTITSDEYSKKITDHNFYFGESQFDFKSFKVGVTGISPELPNLEF